MKKITLIITGLIVLISVGFFFNNKTKANTKITELQEQHLNFLDNSPFKESLQLSKKERKAKGTPPNKYLERRWELTLDPNTGRPHPERLFKIQNELNNSLKKVPGDKGNDWVERGPDNVGGRTRAIMYDPNDSANKRVFAGGVSGGLWVNSDITDPDSAWSEVGINQNLSISCITYDPNDTTIFYVGTGESYVQGDVNGNGVWRSLDSGNSWAQILGGVTGEAFLTTNAQISISSPTNLVGNYIAVLATAFGGQLESPITGEFALVSDGTGVFEDACESIINGSSIAGKIALIKRGDCNFDDKIKKAQDAGAIAVVMVNNIAGEPSSMGGDDTTITIPSVMVTQDTGNTIIAELGSEVTGTITLNSSTVTGLIIPGIQHINDIVVRDMGATSELYVAAGSTRYFKSSPSGNLGINESGLYKSIDNGNNFTKENLPLSSSDTPLQPNDIEISADNTVWLSTRSSEYDGSGGGLIYNSVNGDDFTLKYSIPGGRRTQIAVSSQDPSVIYVLAELASGSSNGVEIIRTDDGFLTETSLPLPIAFGTAVPANDFTSGQAFYNLLIEVDPNNDNNIYVGGIDLFKSTDGGTQWQQISEYYTSSPLDNVHPDQHAMVFDPSDSNKAIFGNDGGIYYATSLSNPDITARNKNYNVTQFYNGSIGQGNKNPKFLAGAQDNSSQLINDATSGINGSDVVKGGDGAYCFIDKDGEFMLASSQNGNFHCLDYDDGGFVYSVTGGSVGGQFITPADLDSDNNMLFMDGGDDDSGNNQILRYEIGESSTLSTISLINPLLTLNPTAFKASTFVTTTLFVGTTDGKLLKLQNSNTANPIWSDISGPDFVGSISCVELGVTENDIYVTFYNYGVSNIFYSSDGGSSWLDKENDLPDIPVSSIMANPLNANEVIVGTDLGVWGTANFNDAQPNWSQAQNGMKNVNVTSFDLRTADNMVLATTYGRGMFTGQFTNEASSLSVDQFSENNLIKVYPTVSNGNFMISPNSEVREGKLSVFDINGRNIHSSKVNFDNSLEQSITLNVASGMYIVKFTSNELQSTHKIIIE
jgi:photosystem II stability/assembly factor-like uncharacterized protein